MLPWSANACIFLLDSGLPKPQNTRAPGHLANGVGAELCSPALRLLRTWTGGLWVLREAGPRKLRALDVLFWSLIPGEQVTPGHMARKQSPCSRAPAPEAAAAAGLKPGRLVLCCSFLAWSLQPPFSFFQLQMKLPMELCKWARGWRQPGGPLCHSLDGSSGELSWVSEEKRRGRKGCPRKELAALGCCSTFKPKGVPENV